MASLASRLYSEIKFDSSDEAWVARSLKIESLEDEISSRALSSIKSMSASSRWVYSTRVSNNLASSSHSYSSVNCTSSSKLSSYSEAAITSSIFKLNLSFVISSWDFKDSVTYSRAVASFSIDSLTLVFSKSRAFSADYVSSSAKASSNSEAWSTNPIWRFSAFVKESLLSCSTSSLIALNVFTTFEFKHSKEYVVTAQGS